MTTVTRAAETKAVKDALIKAGYAGVKVWHGTGTARSWLNARVEVAKPVGCTCDIFHYCHECKAVMQQQRWEIETLIQNTTGRGGWQDDRISVKAVTVEKGAGR